MFLFFKKKKKEKRVEEVKPQQKPIKDYSPLTAIEEEFIIPINKSLSPRTAFNKYVGSFDFESGQYVNAISFWSAVQIFLNYKKDFFSLFINPTVDQIPYYQDPLYSLYLALDSFLEEVKGNCQNHSLSFSIELTAGKYIKGERSLIHQKSPLPRIKNRLEIMDEVDDRLETCREIEERENAINNAAPSAALNFSRFEFAQYLMSIYAKKGYEVERLSGKDIVRCKKANEEFLVKGKLKTLKPADINKYSDSLTDGEKLYVLTNAENPAAGNDKVFVISGEEFALAVQNDPTSSPFALPNFEFRAWAKRILEDERGNE